MEIDMFGRERRNSMEQHLPEADVTQALKSLEDQYAVMRRQYLQGCLSMDDIAKRVRQLFWHMTSEFLSSKGLRYDFSALSWQAFEHAFHQWKAGQPIEDCPGEEWLFHDNLDQRITDKASLQITRSAGCYGLGESRYASTSMDDKVQFFRIVDRLGISLEYFKPLPENLHLPKRHFTHTYNNSSACVIDFNCISDDGLCASLSPVGKRFGLRDDLGLTANVLIREVRSEEEIRHTRLDVDEYAPLARYLAEGTIEGYTSGRTREITIRTDRNNVICKCGLFLEEDDEQACRDFPLWQEGYQWFAHQEGLIEAMCEKAVLSICD